MNRAFLPFMKSIFVVLLASSVVISIAEPAFAADGDAAKGATLYGSGDAARGIPACVTCHGASGNATITANPKLAAQHEAYIVKQLSNFKSGDRSNPVMGPIAKMLSTDDAANVAAYLNAQTLTPGAAKNKATVELGKKIYRAGIAGKNVPACAACHGPAGAGIPAQFARIGGQNTDYTVAQLTNFGNDSRKNNPVMSAVAKRLSGDEIQAVADYISGLK